MIKQHGFDRTETKGSANASLESLSRTLEALETRLSKLTDTSPSSRRAPLQVEPPAPAAAPAPPERRRPSFSDAVSEIVLRRQMLDAEPATPVEARAPSRQAPSRLSTMLTPEPSDARPLQGRAMKDVPLPDDRDGALDRRFRALAGDVEALKQEGNSYSMMADVAAELQRLRDEIRASGQRNDPRFDALRGAFDDLRSLIERRGDSQTINFEITRIGKQLERLTEEGADRSTLNTLRAELEEMRNLFGEFAREKTVRAVGQRWDEFENRYKVQTERDGKAQRDLKEELERLRDSLRSLASEDQVRAVERRWDEFEERYLDASSATSEQVISKLLREELESMREKLEGLAAQAPMKDVEQRWGALEKRLDSREMETSIHRLGERMAEIETTLARLPDTLSIAPLEERVRQLAQGVDSLARQALQPDPQQFSMLEERLDEISRAIVAASRQTAAIDMAPIERIEARIAALSSRVDRITVAGEAVEGDTAQLSGRISELSDKVEELVQNRVAEELSARVAGLAERLEVAMADMERPRAPDPEYEARLQALAARLEEAVQPQSAPQIDPEMIRALEGQIGRLADHLVNSSRLSDEIDAEFDRRLASVEQRLEDNRDALMAAARAAAEEAVRRVQINGDAREGEHVARLADSLRSLEALSRDTDHRSTQVFEAVHATLLKIVDRLEKIEDDLGRTANAALPLAAPAGLFQDIEMPEFSGQTAPTGRQAAGSVSGGARASGASPAKAQAEMARPMMVSAVGETPGSVRTEARSLERNEVRERALAPALDAAEMLDRREANRPLEPGSGAPDVAALLDRVRAHQRGQTVASVDPANKADFIAAARRAAVAAAATVKADAETMGPPVGDEAAGPNGSRGLAALLAKRRKPILMAVGAVLLALMALPLGAKLIGSSSAPTIDAVPIERTVGENAAASATSGSGDLASASAAGANALGTSTQPAAPSDMGMVAPMPAESGPAGIGDAPALPAGGTSDASSPIAANVNADAGAANASAPSADLMSAAPTAATQTFPPAPASDGALLALASAKLPAAVAGDIPAVPDAVASGALAQAARGGDPKALFEVGLRLLEGRNSEPKPAEALVWFGRSASRGFAPAQYSLGTLYEKGNSVPRDTVAARDWYLLAANQGNVRAMHNLAVLFATGVDGKSDPEAAAGWFEKAADLGMRDSQYNLGILYARGSGVEQDLGQAYKWFAIVGKSGDKDADAKRQEIGKSLSPEKLKEADTVVAGWVPKPRVDSVNTVEIPKEWADRTQTTSSVDMTRALRNIQTILGKLGYDAGTPDGVVGAKTKTAIAAFQKTAGLKATGEIDEPLIRALLQRKDG